jgi:ParB family chromosome partitioning protein
VSADFTGSAPGGRRRGLGRGLSALFGEETEDYTEPDRARPPKTVPIESLRPSRFQPRRGFDEEALASLVESIRAKGVLQPILVRRHPEAADVHEIIAGERRWRAAQRAQFHEVPVIVRDFSDRDALEVALVENIQRQDLTPLEEAEGYQRLAQEFGHTQEDLAHILGRSRSHVANMLRLLSLPEPVKEMLQSGALTAGHARPLINAEDPAALAGLVVKRGLNVRQTEKLAASRKPGGTPRRQVAAKDADTLALERDISNLLGLKVTITFRRQKGGNLVIHYQTLEQLDDILQRLSAKLDEGVDHRL